MVEHFYVKIGDAKCIGFWDIVRISKYTDRQTTNGENPAPATAVDVGIWLTDWLIDWSEVLNSYGAMNSE